MAAKTFHYESEFTRGIEARGRVAMLLRILAARGIEVDEEARARIAGCTDLEQLDTWGERAVAAVTAADLFA